MASELAIDRDHCQFLISAREQLEESLIGLSPSTEQGAGLPALPPRELRPQVHLLAPYGFRTFIFQHIFQRRKEKCLVAFVQVLGSMLLVAQILSRDPPAPH